MLSGFVDFKDLTQIFSLKEGNIQEAYKYDVQTRLNHRQALPYYARYI